MSNPAMTTRNVRCACGGVIYEAIGTPITSVVCYCASCQDAGRAFERLPAAPAVLETDGGTAAVLYRKDRVRCVEGQGHLKAYRLKPDSPTRRLVATCCNTAMFLDFTKGHWLSMYRCRFATDAPEIEMRVMTRDRRASVALPNDVPNYRGHSGRFIVKLLATWIAMRLPTPNFDIEGTSG
jgi:hypothetical protein